jgi:hypothetical protein
MSDANAYPRGRSRLVSRRAFLQSTTVVPAALASPELLGATGGTTTARAGSDLSVAQGCEPRLPLVPKVPL